MRYVIVAVCAGTLVLSVTSAPTFAQTNPTRSADEIRALYDAHKGDFDYLLGDWEFTAESKEYGKFGGLWSAVRLDTGQILDEYRITDEKGEAIYVTSTLRNYNGALDRWELVGVNPGNGLQDIGTGRKVGDEVHLEQTFGATTDKPSRWKIRYYNIGPDRFSWTADRSTDGGKTWVSQHQTIEAHRIGPPRSLGALATRPKSTPPPASSGDPISGRWGANGLTFLELTLGTDNVVSGTAIWRSDATEVSRGPIKTGTFDPKTGLVRLEGEAKRPDTGAAGRYVIEGKLDKETFAGTFTFDERKGEFTFTRQ
jgi:hypothetical protein